MTAGLLLPLLDAALAFAVDDQLQSLELGQPSVMAPVGTTGDQNMYSH